MRGQWSQDTFFIGTSLHLEDTVGLFTSLRKDEETYVLRMMIFFKNIKCHGESIYSELSIDK
jgi:hypothetical protein